jgi:serine O-acetyltransferase
VIIGAGAQVLGGFTVGEGAKVGSNAVVVKEVPAGATAIGNPARVIAKDTHPGRDDAAARMFAAYGLTPNGDDPLSKALHGLIDNAASQETQLQKIVAALKAAGIAVEEVAPSDRFDADQLKENAEAFIQTVIRLKPSSAKGTYVKSINMSSTMGPGVPVSRAGMS